MSMTITTRYAKQDRSKPRSHGGEFTLFDAQKQELYLVDASVLQKKETWLLELVLSSRGDTAMDDVIAVMRSTSPRTSFKRLSSLL